jgi:hypothetical protein
VFALVTLGVGFGVGALEGIEDGALEADGDALVLGIELGCDVDWVTSSSLVEMIDWALRTERSRLREMH